MSTELIYACGLDEFSQHVAPIMSHVCDFCNQSPVAWKYPARDFIAFELESLIEGIAGSRSEGAWAACHECHALIEADDRFALCRRATLEFLRLTPEAEMVDIVEYMVDLHLRFFENRIGSAEGLC